MNLYILLNLLILAGPLALSFDKRVAFYRQWPAVFPAIAVVVVSFGLWDVWMTAASVWWFSPRFAGSFYLLGLPPGEWLFFICVPYACIFILACVHGYLKDRPLQLPRWFWFALAALALLAAALFWQRLYSFTNFLALAIIVTAAAIIIPDILNSRNFWLAMLITYIPFVIANGILTALPIVLYDDSMNLGIRIGSIPLDDFIYSFSMLLLGFGGYEFLGKRWGLFVDTRIGKETGSRQ